MAYREIIVKMARCHRWEHVAKYDRRFRQEAAGKTEVKWEEEKMNLIFDIVYSTSDSKGDGGANKQSGAGNVTVPRREQKRRGACYRFNRMNGSCVYGTQCRFAHVCSVWRRTHSDAVSVQFCRKGLDAGGERPDLRSSNGTNGKDM